jgi:hypothetical protein
MNPCSELTANGVRGCGYVIVSVYTGVKEEEDEE